MSLARRLLMQGSGATPYTILRRILTSAPDGGWNQQSDPKAIQYGGYLYVGWIDASGNAEIAVAADDGSALGTPVTLRASMTVDLHTSPSLHVRSSDHKLLAFYTAHNDTALRMRVSANSLDTDPTLSAGFAAEVNLDSQVTGSEYTYPTIYEFNGNLQLWFRDRSLPNAWCSCSYSTDGGSTWVTVRHFLQNGTVFPYFKVRATGTRQDLVIASGHPIDDAPAGLWHLYSSTTAWYQSDGTAIGGSPPWAHTVGTEVDDGSSGSCWVMDVALEGTSNARVLYWRGTYGQGDMDIVHARWNGSAWVSTVITNVGGDTSTYYAPGGAVFDRGDPDVVYLAKWSGTYLEAFRYETADSGATWTGQQLTWSTSDAIWPGPVAGRSTGMRAVWLRGTVTAEDTFSLGIEGTTI